MTYEANVGEILCNSGGGKPRFMRWTEWGDASNRAVLICAHGLSRNGRDFDFLARRLAARYRVVCPDYAGRGASDWMEEAGRYTNEQYVVDSLRLIEALPHDHLDWVGTSMGGLIGMALAAMPERPIRRLVVNDVGPFIPSDALRVIKLYLKFHPRFADKAEAERYFREAYAGFGPLEDYHYQHMVNTGIRAEGGGYVLDYDPALIDEFIATEDNDVDLWPLWQMLDCPALIIRGERSGLLLAETVEQMKQGRDNVDSLEFTRCAHAPSLMVEDQIDAVDAWLARSP